MWMWVIALEAEIFVSEPEYVLDIRIDYHPRQWARLACELQTGLIEMVEVEMGVAESMHEIAGLEACHLRHHLQQKGVGGYVEGHSEEAVGAALIELPGSKIRSPYLPTSWVSAPR